MQFHSFVVSRVRWSIKYCQGGERTGKEKQVLVIQLGSNWHFLLFFQFYYSLFQGNDMRTERNFSLQLASSVRCLQPVSVYWGQGEDLSERRKFPVNTIL